MRCRVCGTELEPNAKICRVCGISVSTSSKVAPITLNNKSNNQNNGEDITSFFFNTAPSNDISSRINEGLNSNFQKINNQPFFNNQNSNQDNDIDLNKQQPIQNNQNLNPNNKVSNKMNSNKSVFFQNNQINQVNNSDVNNQNNPGYFC